MEPGSTDPRRFLEGVLQRTGDLRERAELMQAELAAITETVSSRDDLAAVTVGAGGIMRGLTITAGGTRVPPDQLARSIMTAYQSGCRSVAEQAAAVMQRHAPGSPAVTMMRDAVPPDPEPAEEERR